MPYPFSRKDKFLSFFALSLLITVGTNAGPANVFLRSPLHRAHISLKNSLYNKEEKGWMNNPDTPGIKHAGSVLSGCVRRQRNSDLVIVVPDTHSGKYKVRFFDEKKKFLFEIKQIRDSLLIVEKLNFQYAGLFQYELYRGDLLVERNTFLIKQD